jgi:hypothetical protein
MRVTAARAGVGWRAVLLWGVLPLFGQVFQYVVDVGPLYGLSKVWPLLVAPWAVLGLVRLELPYRMLFVVLQAYVFGLTPILSMVQLGNGFVDALMTTAKVWSFSFFFSLSAILMMLRPSAERLRRVMVGLGVATFVLLVLLWEVMPASAYMSNTLGSTRVFLWDVERGYRIMMPIFFGLWLIFYLNRSFWVRPRVWKAAAIVLCFWLLVTIYKERAAIGAAGLVVMFGAVMSLRRWRLVAMAAGAAVLALGVAVFVLGQHAATLQQNLGGSLSVRQNTVAIAFRFIGDDPLRWLLGVGGITRFGSVNFVTLFGDPNFFLTDIGWLGIVFEYGALGATLIAATYLAGARLALGAARPGDPFSQACGDHAVYLLVVSAAYSAVYAPGELGTVMALAWYARELAVRGYGAAQSGRPSPRQAAAASMAPSGWSGVMLPSGPPRRG